MDDLDRKHFRRITMPDGRTGVVRIMPTPNALSYPVEWDDGTTSVITPGDYAAAQKEPLPEE